MIVTVISYPLNEINYSVDVPNTFDASKIVQYLWVDVDDAPTDEYIEVTYNSVVKTFLITDECRHDPVDIIYQNKEGAVQIMTFFKVRKDSMTVKNEIFESSRSLSEHQFVKYNVNSKSKFTVNTGFITEDKNEDIKQLLDSERAWLIVKRDGRFRIDLKTLPVNVSTTSQEFKTRRNDKLINYAIEFEFAFNDINNV